jgi:hypothetical protein
MYESTRTDGTKVTRYSCAETAKLLRASLKATFPGVKFSVRSSTYSGGASINVRWTDGPRTFEVKAVTDRYEGATFDGMIDLKSYKDDVLIAFDGEDTPRLVSFGADFIFEDRDYSPEYVAVLEAAAVEAMESSADYHDKSLDDLDSLGYGRMATKFGRGTIALHGKHSFIRAMGEYVAPDGSVYTTDKYGPIEEV